MIKKKIIKLIIGTNNSGKLREIRDLLPNKVKIYSPKEFKLKSPKENGKTFKENSLIKAKFFSKKTKMICLADDSGMEIDIFDEKGNSLLNENGFKIKNIWGDYNKNKFNEESTLQIYECYI